MSKQQPCSRTSGELHPYAGLLHELEELRSELKGLEQSSSAILQNINPVHLPGAINLVHYLGLRRRDMRSLQERLAALGLSSLGRMESHVLTQLDAIIYLLQCALGKNPVERILPAPDASGAMLLENNTNGLFGKPPSHRRVRIMVTLPTEVADDYSLIKDMLLHGMDCARINCAHDTPAIWARMIEQVNLAHRETGIHCRALMDLGGPKLRTGEMPKDLLYSNGNRSGIATAKWLPRREYGCIRKVMRHPAPLLPMPACRYKEIGWQK